MLSKSFNDAREAVSPVMAVAREAADTRAVQAHNQPVAVMLDLMNPDPAGRWPRHFAGRQGSTKPEGRCKIMTITR